MKENFQPRKEIPFSLEHWIKNEFEKDYNDQVKILDNLGLLEILPEKGEMGILGIDGKEYPIPTKEQIIAEIMNDKEKYETKMKQGFVQIQLTPFASPLEKLVDVFKKSLLKHYKEKKLFITKEDLSDPDKLMELNEKEPFAVWDGWVDPKAPQGLRGADVTGKCVYYPSAFKKEGHGGKTKKEILDKQSEHQEPFAGWMVILTEKKAEVAQRGAGKIIGDRKQIESYCTSEKILKAIKNDAQYANEQGLSNEDWLIKFIIHLEKTNIVIDDINGDDCGSLLLASFYFNFEFPGRGYCDSKFGQVTLHKHSTNFNSSTFVQRTAVAVGKQWT